MVTLSTNTLIGCPLTFKMPGLKTRIKVCRVCVESLCSRIKKLTLRFTFKVANLTNTNKILKGGGEKHHGKLVKAKCCLHQVAKENLQVRRATSSWYNEELNFKLVKLRLYRKIHFRIIISTIQVNIRIIDQERLIQRTQNTKHSLLFRVSNIKTTKSNHFPENVTT